MPKNIETLGELVKKARKEKKISARKLAQLCDVSHTEINNIEKGIRINNISKELNGEKIDVVQYDKDLVTFIKNALSPAKEVEVYILDPKENKVLAVADGDNLSLAIGKKGQNVKLAARLTKCKIDVKTSSQVQEEGINIYKYYEA